MPTQAVRPELRLEPPAAHEFAEESRFAPLTPRAPATYPPASPRFAEQPGFAPSGPVYNRTYAQAPPYARPVQYEPKAGYAAGENNFAQSRTAPGGGQSTEQHLPAWMRKHQNEPPLEQERALRQEPGFNRLGSQQQQNLINTLHRLDSMPPDQRERTLMRMENMERLNPQMRDAVRSSARQLSDLPQDRRRLWQKAFRDLRDMPPEQRQEVMNSPQFAGEFSAQERSIMGNLLAVEPYQRPGPMQLQPQYGK